MKSLFTQISNEERSSILEMHKPKKVISEQPLPPANNGFGAIPGSTTQISKQQNNQKNGPLPPEKNGLTVPNLDQQSGQQKEEQKKRLSCVKPEQFTIESAVGGTKYFQYADKTGYILFYDNGLVELRQNKDNVSSPVIKKGTWKCGSNENLEVSWENDPKSIAYYPNPSQRHKKGLNLENCAQNIKDIHSGKFLFKGCKSPAVKELQSKLGFTKTTDFFGDITKNKVIAFQRQNRINADGIVGQDTLSFLIPNVYQNPS